MPRRKKLPYKVLIARLLASKKLSTSEQAAFEDMQRKLASGQELTEHQKLWIETLRSQTEGQLQS